MLHTTASRAALLLLFLTNAVAHASDQGREKPAPAPTMSASIEDRLLEAASRRGDEAIEHAVAVILRRGFLPDLVDAIEVDDAYPGQDQVRRLNRKAHLWLKGFSYNGPLEFAKFQLLTNDWAPQKETVKIVGHLWLRNTHRNTYRKSKIRLEMSELTAQVLSWKDTPIE